MRQMQALEGLIWNGEQMSNITPRDNDVFYYIAGQRVYYRSAIGDGVMSGALIGLDKIAVYDDKIAFGRNTSDGTSRRSSVETATEVLEANKPSTLLCMYGLGSRLFMNFKWGTYVHDARMKNKTRVEEMDAKTQFKVMTALDGHIFGIDDRNHFAWLNGNRRTDFGKFESITQRGNKIYALREDGSLHEITRTKINKRKVYSCEQVATFQQQDSLQQFTGKLINHNEYLCLIQNGRAYKLHFDGTIETVTDFGCDVKDAISVPYNTHLRILEGIIIEGLKAR